MLRNILLQIASLALSSRARTTYRRKDRRQEHTDETNRPADELRPRLHALPILVDEDTETHREDVGAKL